MFPNNLSSKKSRKGYASKLSQTYIIFRMSISNLSKEENYRTMPKTLNPSCKNYPKTKQSPTIKTVLFNAHSNHPS